MGGRIKTEDIDQVRERADLVEVISDFVNLKKRGRLFWGLCPFHKEKTPSFKVDPATQLYHCFGCGEGGNVFTFLMKMDTLEFPEAVQAVADRIGYRLTFEETKTGREASSKAARLIAMHEAAANFYHDQLMKPKEGEKARQYLKGRGFGGDTAKAFRIGFGSDRWDALLAALTKQGFKAEEALAAGLVIRGEKGMFDRFRKRIIFPILDVRGRVVAFGGRVVGDEVPKYMNSPETPIYHKSSTLYGLSSAKGAIVSSGHAVVVEGYTDVMACHQKGVTNVVATLGTAFTPEHVQALSRFCHRIVLVFDADTAGEKAAERGMEFASQFKVPAERQFGGLVEKGGVDIDVATLPQGSDPADFLTQEGPEAFTAAVGAAVPLVEFSMERILGEGDLAQASARRTAAKKVLGLIARLPDRVEQETYVARLAGRLSVYAPVATESLLGELRRLAKGSGAPTYVSRRTEAARQGGVQSQAASDPQTQTERLVLQMFLQKPDETLRYARELAETLFVEPIHRNLFSAIRDSADGPNPTSLAGFIDGLDPEVRTLATGLAVEDTHVDNWEKYCQDILSRLKGFDVQRQINTLKQELEGLKRDRDPKRFDALFRNLVDLEAGKRGMKQPTVEQGRMR